MMKKTLVVLLAAVLLAAACGSARRGEPLVGPVAVADPSVQRGRISYDKHCYNCHLNGEGGLAPAFNHLPLPRFLIRFQVRHGLGAMPAFAEEQISDQELQDIVNYMVALRRQT